MLLGNQDVRGGLAVLGSDGEWQGVCVTERYILPDRLDSSAATGLMQALLDRRGQPLVLDASKVDLIGALALEVIISAGKQWSDDGHSLTVSAASDRFRASCDALGLDPVVIWAPLNTTPSKIEVGA